jgi:hypothetical protein
MELPLDESANGTANAAGKATASLQPLRAFENWHVDSVSVFSTSVLVSTFKVYRGSESPSTLIGGTYSGNLNSDPSFNKDVRNGERLLGVWEGCTPGAVCTMSVTGTKSGR